MVASVRSSADSTSSALSDGGVMNASMTTSSLASVVSSMRNWVSVSAASASARVWLAADTACWAAV